MAGAIDQRVFELRIAIEDLRKHVIGLFKARSGNTYLVLRAEPVNEKDLWIHAGIFSPAGSFNTINILSSEGEYIPFPDEKNMVEMLEEPMQYSEFCKQFKT